MILAIETTANGQVTEYEMHAPLLVTTIDEQRYVVVMGEGCTAVVPAQGTLEIGWREDPDDADTIAENRREFEEEMEEALHPEWRCPPRD